MPLKALLTLNAMSLTQFPLSVIAGIEKSILTKCVFSCNDNVSYKVQENFNNYAKKSISGN